MQVKFTYLFTIFYREYREEKEEDESELKALEKRGIKIPRNPIKRKSYIELMRIIQENLETLQETSEEEDDVSTETEAENENVSKEDNKVGKATFSSKNLTTIFITISYIFY